MAFAVALERLGARLAVSVGWDSLRLTVQTAPDALADALALLAEALYAPRLDAPTT